MKVCPINKKSFYSVVLFSSLLTLKSVSCQKKIQYEEELVAFVKLPKERSIVVGPFDVCLAKTAQEIYCKSCYDKKA